MLRFAGVTHHLLQGMGLTQHSIRGSIRLIKFKHVQIPERELAQRQTQCVTVLFERHGTQHEGQRFPMATAALQPLKIFLEIDRLHLDKKVVSTGKNKISLAVVSEHGCIIENKPMA